MSLATERRLLGRLAVSKFPFNALGVAQLKIWSKSSARVSSFCRSTHSRPVPKIEYRDKKQESVVTRSTFSLGFRCRPWPDSAAEGELE
jgi:hypothetical protein